MALDKAGKFDAEIKKKWEVLDLGDYTFLLGSGVGFREFYGGGSVYHALRQGLSSDSAQRFW